MTAPTLARNAIGVRRLPAPALAPPYDDERRDVPAGRLGGTTLPLPFPIPSAAVPRLRLVAAPVAVTASLASPAPWSARFVRVLLEAFAGLRPISQLGAWASSDVCRVLSRRMGAADRCRDRRRAAGNLRSLHVSTPAAGVAEVCAIVAFGDRIRAIALRVEASDGQWRCTELEVG